MKILFTLITAIALCGCTTVYTPQGPGYKDHDCGKVHRHGLLFAPAFSLVNNTGVILDVYQNGEMIYQGLETGQVLPVRQPFTLALNFNVSVVGHTSSGEYAGTKSWYYRNGHPEVWTITYLERPRP